LKNALAALSARPHPNMAAEIAACAPLLAAYGWPGNVRELRNVVERLLLLAEGAVDAGAVRLALPSLAANANGSERPRFEGTLAQRVEAFERDVILAELKRHSQRMTDTAKSLGLERSHLYKKCQALGIDLRAMRRGEES
jgi:two-component system, NtrC family, nitrogen regulation response regulator NtrX